MIRKRLTPGVMLGVLALVFAMASSAVAAKLITGASIKDKSITGKDIKNKSLTKKQFRGSVRGPAGSAGPAGPAGAQGFGNLTVVESPHVSLPPGGVTPPGWYATCPAGTSVIGTGFYSSVTDVGFVKAYGTFAGGIMFNHTGITVNDLHIQAMCASGGGAVAASVGNITGKRAYAADRRSATR